MRTNDGGIVVRVSAANPATLAAVSVLLAAVALAALWIPARRASRLDPIAAMRDD